MNRLQAWCAVAFLAAANVLALVLPVAAVAAVAVLSVAALRTRRLQFLAFALVTVALTALWLAVLVPGPDPWRLGPLSFGLDGAVRGLAGGLRLAAILGANLAVLSWLSAERILDGLGLPPRAVAFLGAVLLAAHDLGRDASRLATARRLDGAWPKGRVARAGAAALLVPPLAVLALRRAGTRSQALRLAGHDMGAGFAPLVAVTALAVAGRLALVAIPNVSLTYLVVFAGGLLFGARIGFWSGVLAMAVSNLLLTGVYLVPFANAPAMGLLGLLGGALRRVDFAGTRRADVWAGRVLAATCGLAATLLFSVAVDALTWLAVPEYRAESGALRALVLAGLAFNALPAVVNAALFAAAVAPLTRAARQAGTLAPAGIAA